MWKDAERVARHAVSIDPYDVIGMRALLLAILNGKGDVNEAQKVLGTFPPDNKIIIASIAGDVGSVTGERAYTFVLGHKFRGCIESLGNNWRRSQRRTPTSLSPISDPCSCR